MSTVLKYSGSLNLRENKGIRVGKIATPNLSAGVPYREANANLTRTTLLGTNGYPGLVERMINSYPKLQSSFRDTETQAGAANWSIELPGDADSPPSNQEEDFTEASRIILLDESVCDFENAHGDFVDYIERTMRARAFGFGLTELSWYPDPSAFMGMRLEMFGLHQSSIGFWNFDGQWLESITQWTECGGNIIPSEKLLHIMYGTGYPVGESLVRCLAFFYEAAVQGVVSYSEALEHLAGILVASLPRHKETSADLNSVDRMEDLIEEYDTTNGPKRMLLPNGSEFDVKFPSGSVPDVTIFLRHFDSMIDDLIGRTLRSLGHSPNGSRALGDVASSADSKLWTANLNRMGKMIGQRLFPWLATQLGYEGIRMPTLQIAEEEESQDVGERMELLGKAIMNDLITWNPDDESELRQDLGVLTFEELAERREGRSNEDVTELAKLLGGRSAEAKFDPQKDLYPLIAAANANIIQITDEDEEELRNKVGIAPKSLTKLPRLVGEAATQTGDALAAPGSEVGAPTPSETGPVIDAPALLSDMFKPRNIQLGKCDTTHCGCVNLGEPVVVLDVDGEEFTTNRPLEGVEKLVQWAEITRDRADLEARQAEAIANIALEHRAAVGSLLEGERTRVDPELDDGLQDILTQYTQQYRSVVDTFAAEARDIVATRAPAERQRQLDQNLHTGGVEPGTLEEFVQNQNDTVNAQAGSAANRIAQRVQGEVVTAWEANPVFSSATFASRQTDDGLLREARPVANRSESIGRIADAVDTQEPGMAVSGVIRTSVRDTSRCSVCENRDLLRWDFPEDFDDFQTQEEARVPDPDCLGSDTRCRCGFIILWAKA